MPATRCKLSGRSDRRTLGSVFERFTEAARRVVVLSQEEARLLNHNYIGTEHLLLALVGQDDTVAAPALRRSGITPRSARAEVETVIGLGTSAPSGHIPFTPRAKKVLELSLREAQRLGDRRIRPAHILLGLLREGEGVAVQVLERLGVNLAELHRVVIDALGGRGEDTSGLPERYSSQGGTLRTAEPVVRCPGCDFEVDLVGAPGELHIRIERGADDPRFRIHVTMSGGEVLVHECESRVPGA